MEDLIKRLRDRAGAFDYDGRPDIACDYEQAADAIEELQERVAASEATIKRQSDIIQVKDRDLQRAIDAKPQWIPVTERLPKFGVKALCKCRANIYEVLKWTAEGWEHDPQHIYMSGFVTHWMPLPEPPKEET